jgi:hypothetical protein
MVDGAVEFDAESSWHGVRRIRAAESGKEKPKTKSDPMAPWRRQQDRSR